MKFINRVFVVAALLCCCMALEAEAASVDTLYVSSKGMGRDIRTVVVAPDAPCCEASAKSGVPNKSVKYPVVYLLHGYSGAGDGWFKVRPDLRELSDRYQMIFVCPDGGNSWYWDSPEVKGMRYETFVSRELPRYIDSRYSTIASRAGRAITGFSMGGHGALWNAFRNSDVFGAVGSMSGGVDIRPYAGRWDIDIALGTQAEHPGRWERYTCMSLVDKLKNKRLAIIVDCGVDDFFLDVNRSFHGALVERGIAHEYVEREGAHTLAYWRKALYYQLFFFDNYFGR